MNKETADTSAPESAEGQSGTLAPEETPAAATSTDTSIVDINIDEGTVDEIAGGVTDDTADSAPEDTEQAAIDKAMSPLSQEELASLDSFNELVSFGDDSPRTTEFTAEDGNTTYSTREP